MAQPLSQGDRASECLGHSQEESAQTLALTGFYWLNLHRNTGCIWKAHQSLSGNNNQIDNICQGALTQPPGSTMDEAVAMVARSLWSVQVLKILRSLFRAPDVGGALTQPPRVRHG